jgi:MYXO-CTERM domain-containing protein
MRELVMLSALAALGCAVAAAQGDLLFVALFGASVVAIIEAIRRSR